MPVVREVRDVPARFSLLRFRSPSRKPDLIALTEQALPVILDWPISKRQFLQPGQAVEQRHRHTVLVLAVVQAQRLQGPPAGENLSFPLLNPFVQFRGVADRLRVLTVRLIAPSVTNAEAGSSPCLQRPSRPATR